MSRKHVLFLLGPPGSGKTALGTAACARLGLRFVDAPDHAPSDARTVESAAMDADVVALPWELQSDAAIVRAARRLGTTVALWAHPETLQARARQPIAFTARRGLVTGGGFGRHGTSCLEYRRLERACDFMLDLEGLSEPEAVDELASTITEVRSEQQPGARLDAIRADVEEELHEEHGPRHASAVKTLAHAMARHLWAREAAGASPRSLHAVRSDLHAAAMLVLMYEPVNDERILDPFRHGAPYVYEFRRKFSDSPRLVARYEKSLRAFADFLGGAETGAT
jgi:hypothetical protein